MILLLDIDFGTPRRSHLERQRLDHREALALGQKPPIRLLRVVSKRRNRPRGGLECLHLCRWRREGVAGCGVATCAIAAVSGSMPIQSAAGSAGTNCILVPWR